MTAKYDRLIASLQKLHKQMHTTARVMVDLVDNELHPNVTQLVGAAGMVADWVQSLEDEKADALAHQDALPGGEHP